MGRKCKTGLTQKTLYFMKRDEKGNALPYLEAVAITFYRIKSGFAIYTRKIRFHFRPRSFL
jgi:hypothetical protein